MVQACARVQIHTEMYKVLVILTNLISWYVVSADTTCGYLELSTMIVRYNRPRQQSNEHNEGYQEEEKDNADRGFELHSEGKLVQRTMII